MNITDDALRQAAALARDAMLASLPEPEDCPTDCSPRLRRRLDRLARRQRHPVLFRTVRQAACLLAALVLGGGWLSADGQARASFVRWARQVYETQIVFRFTGEAAESGVYRVGWVPEGYTEWKVHASPNLSSVAYTNADGRILSFGYGPMHEGAGFAVTDTDKTTIKQVDIAGTSGELYLSTDPALSSVLTWLDEEYGMHFGITGFLDESDMLHMAESVYLEESTN